MAQPYASAPPMGPPTNPTNLVTKVQLSMSCKGLVDKDLLSKSDPLAVVCIFSGNQWVEVCIFYLRCMFIFCVNIFVIHIIGLGNSRSA